MPVYRLIAGDEMPRPELPEQLTGIELKPEDQWILLLYPHGEKSPSREDPEIVDQLQKIRTIAEVDQEDRSRLPKTTATFFQTIRKLGNLGAHEAGDVVTRSP